jgi:pimeloyl-ACP methyl ester carboxylesterase
MGRLFHEVTSQSRAGRVCCSRYLQRAADSILDGCGEGKSRITSTPVEIHVSEHLALRGERYGAPTERWAVLVHEEGRDLDGWRTLVRRLPELGVCALAFDLAGHGASEGQWEPRNVTADVIAALRFGKSQGARRMCVVGAGAGATAALAAAGEVEVQGIVALSPRAELDGLGPEAIRETLAPKLIIVGSGDPVAAAEADHVFRRSIGWSLLQSLPTELQGTALLGSSWAEQVAESTLAFLRDYL